MESNADAKAQITTSYIRASRILWGLELVLPAAILAFGVSAWEYLVHVMLGHDDGLAGHLQHIVRDGLLMLPLTLLSVQAGLWRVRRWGAEHMGRWRLPIQAVCISVVLALFLVPSVTVHHWIDSALSDRGTSASLAHAAVLLPTTEADPKDDRGVREPTTGIKWLAIHGLRDSLFALAAAPPLALLGLVLVASVRRTSFSNGRTGKAVWRRVGTLALAGALGFFVVNGIVGEEGAEAIHARFTTPLAIPSVLTEADISINVAQSQVQILPGNQTTMWTFNGTFPGPTIRRPAGQTTNVTFTNNLPTAAGSLTIHNHGNHSTSANDGQPDSFLIPRGNSRTYAYTGTEDGGPERASTQWYHDHRMGVTGRNVWMGLAGFYIIDDPFEATLPLPRGEFDIPLMIVDRSFNSQNQLSYSFKSSGVTGNHILVNGVPQPYFEVGDRKYRFRILNASNFRDYNLALSTGQPMIQIGTDAGLLPAPVLRTQIRIGPAERVDVVIDFAGMLGQEVVLQNTLGKGNLAGVMQFRVTHDLIEDSSVPSSLRALPDIGTPSVTRTFEFNRTGGQWTINGKPFDANRVDAYPKLDTTERWVLRNKGGWLHMIHIHDVDQQLVSRNGQAPQAHEVIKETWLLASGDTVEVDLKFTDNAGRFVLHCHVLEHEDMMMMAQFEVVP